MELVKGMGGKAACKNQRELRQVCLDNEVFEIDVTRTWPEWRAVLRALPHPRMSVNVFLCTSLFVAEQRRFSTCCCLGISERNHEHHDCIDSVVYQHAGV